MPLPRGLPGGASERKPLEAGRRKARGLEQLGSGLGGRLVVLLQKVGARASERGGRRRPVKTRGRASLTAGATGPRVRPGPGARPRSGPGVRVQAGARSSAAQLDPGGLALGDGGGRGRVTPGGGPVSPVEVLRGLRRGRGVPLGTSILAVVVMMVMVVVVLVLGAPAPRQVVVVVVLVARLGRGSVATGLLLL